MKDFCPHCGTARVGAFRFCVDCRLDFDSFETDSDSPLAATHATKVDKATLVAAGQTSAGRFPAGGLLSAGLAIAIGLASLGSVTEVGPSSQASVVATATASPRIVAAATATPTLTPAPFEELTSGPTGETTEARVVRVVDGDTIAVAFGGKEYEVRYIGMNTPETVDLSSPVEWLGPQASAANRALVAGKTVVLEKDVTETDRYGRLLRYVWLTDGATWTLVNLELVKEGFASVATNPPDVKYVDVYLAAEQKARGTEIGLWGGERTLKPASKPTVKPTHKPITKPEAKPKPTPKPKAKPASECHPSSDPCVPIVGDATCPDVGTMGKAPDRVTGSATQAVHRDSVGCQ